MREDRESKREGRTVVDEDEDPWSAEVRRPREQIGYVRVGRNNDSMECMRESETHTVSPSRNSSSLSRRTFFARYSMRWRIVGGDEGELGLMVEEEEG